MSWWDSATRSWQGGYPPNAQAFEQTMRKLKRTAPPVELAETAAQPAAINGETLQQAQERRRAHHAEQAAAWLSEAETCEALELDASALYRDVALLAGCQMQGGELRFPAADVAQRAEGRGQTASDDDTRRAADALLAAFKQQGLDLGGAA